MAEFFVTRNRDPTGVSKMNIPGNVPATTQETGSDEIRENGDRDIVILRQKFRPNTESSASEVSVDSLTSVNSILSDESSVKTYR